MSDQKRYDVQRQRLELLREAARELSQGLDRVSDLAEQGAYNWKELRDSTTDQLNFFERSTGTCVLEFGEGRM